MEEWYLSVLLVHLIVNTDMAEGCDYYCCAGNRTAFVEAGWRNCCSDESCWIKIRQYGLMPDRSDGFQLVCRNYYEPQLCDVQCCQRGRILHSQCCPVEFCSALDTLNPMDRIHFFITVNLHLHSKSYPFAFEPYADSGWITTTGPPLTSEAPRNSPEFRRQQHESEITGTALLCAVVAFVSLSMIAYVLFCFESSDRTSETIRRTRRSTNIRASRLPTVMVSSAPLNESARRNPVKLTNTSDLPPSYEEVTAS